MTTTKERFTPRYGYNAKRDDARNEAILLRRISQHDKELGARVGDYLQLPNGKLTRFTHDWGESIQTGGQGDGFYLGNGHCSYSGGLNPGVRHCYLEQTEEEMDGSIWFFSCDDQGAHQGVYYNIPFRVFRIKSGTPLDELSGLSMFSESEYSGNSKVYLSKVYAI